MHKIVIHNYLNETKICARTKNLQTQPKIFKYLFPEVKKINYKDHHFPYICIYRNE